MSKSGRSYSDPSYGSEKVIRSVNYAAFGTNALLTIDAHTFMTPAIVTDCNFTVLTAGTGVAGLAYVSKSLGGTGTVTAFGTITLGTNALGAVVDGSVTETSFVAGDDLVFEKGIGTTAGAWTGNFSVKYREVFTTGDN